jgi:signal peptidase I
MIHPASLRPRLRRRWLAILSVVAAVTVAVVTFASPFVVNGISMSSTVQSGEVVLVDRVSTAIGLAGDHISITNGFVYVNGTQLDEPYLAPDTVTLTSVWDFEATVPAGSVFVLGDDRWESWDSRYFGSVPNANIIGRAWLILRPSLSLAAL